MVIFKRQEAAPMSSQHHPVSGRTLRACPLSCVKAKKLIRETQHRFAKGKLCLINLNTYYDEMSGHAAKGTAADTIHLDCPVAFDNIQIRNLRPDGLLGVVEDWLGRQLKT